MTDGEPNSGGALEGLVSVLDYERLAAERMAPGAHGYYAGAADDELTMADNPAAES